jgi:hypothetical protein
MTERRRLLKNLAFPQYAFVPGRTPHPRRVPAEDHGLSEPADDRSAIRFGIDLFNHGYFWEAHEVWETPWRAAAQGSDVRLFRKALIRLAAAALKPRVGNPAGVRAHAVWCAQTFRDLACRHTAIDALAPAELADFAGALSDGRFALRPIAGSSEPGFDREIVPATSIGRRPPP